MFSSNYLLSRLLHTSRDKTYDSRYGYNKRIRHRSSFTPPPLDPELVESLLDAAITEFTSIHADEWLPFANERNEAALRDTARARSISIDAAFSVCLEEGSIAVAIG
jgi:hypothetical protein